MSPKVLLPTEIWLLIAAHSGREELKTLRLTNHAFSVAATEHLFKEIHISPNTHSFNRAHDVAAQDHLRIHVKGLIYHIGMLEEPYPGIDSFRYRYFSARNPSELHNPSTETKSLYFSACECYLKELDGQRTFELSVEEDELQLLVAQLPHLEAISTLLDDVQPFADLHDYIGKRVGLPAATDYGNARFANLFKAVCARSLKHISARSIQWSDLAAIEDVAEITRSCLKNLDLLELGLYSPTSEFAIKDEEKRASFLHSVRHLQDMLQEATGLNTLKLDFDELPFESCGDVMLPISRAIFQQQWPSLRELKLEALCTDETELVDFLKAHAMTLNTLCIGDLELVKTTTELPSILRLFERIRSSLHLKHCRLTGNFTNRIDQAWYVDTEFISTHCLRDELQMFLCRHSPNRVTETEELDEREIEHALQTGTRLELWLHEVTSHYEAFCDDSWYWCPELLE